MFAISMITVFTQKNCWMTPLYICCYMLIATSSKVGIENLKTLSSEFEMKDLGATMKIQGMEILRDRKASLLYLSQH